MSAIGGGWAGSILRTPDFKKTRDSGAAILTLAVDRHLTREIGWRNPCSGLGAAHR
jgi:hypothetical protein